MDKLTSLCQSKEETRTEKLVTFCKRLARPLFGKAREEKNNKDKLEDGQEKDLAQMRGHKRKDPSSPREVASLFISPSPASKEPAGPSAGPRADVSPPALQTGGELAGPSAGPRAYTLDGNFADASSTVIHSPEECSEFERAERPLTEKVYVKTLRGKSIVCCFQDVASTTVADLVKTLEESEGISGQVRLIWEGKVIHTPHSGSAVVYNEEKAKEARQQLDSAQGDEVSLQSNAAMQAALTKFRQDVLEPKESLVHSLKGRRTLASHGISNEATLHLVLTVKRSR